MSEEEVRRSGVMSRIEKGALKQTQAAELLGISYRQLKRLYRRYRERGPAGLVHGNAGRPSNRGKPVKLRQRAVRLIRKHYSGAAGERFGPTLAAEHLAEEYGMRVDSETLRRWMLAAGLWTRERKGRQHRRRRLRKEHFGELLQLDGSFHHWLEERGPQGCLLNLVDDATGLAIASFAEEETTWAVSDLVRAWIERYGIPRAIYTDWKSVYHAPPEREEVAPQLSQFGNMCQKLGIRLMAANSPQAKGRVERHHGTHQDRLVKKMRRLGIGDYAAAGQYLKQQYLPAHNARFAVKAVDPVDYHLPLNRKLDLDLVFCLQYRRTVSNDGVVRFHNRLLQIEVGQLAARAVVNVQELRNAVLQLWHNGTMLRWHAISEAPAKPASDPRFRRRGITSPPRSHPWKREPTIKRRAGFYSAEAGTRALKSPPLALHPIPG
jgi:transposase